MVSDTTRPQSYHVLAGDGAWEVRDDRHQRSLGRFEDRDEAIAVARDAVESAGAARLVVHHTDGSIASLWPTDADPASEVLDDGDLALEAEERAALDDQEPDGELE